MLPPSPSNLRPRSRSRSSSVSNYRRSRSCSLSPAANRRRESRSRSRSRTRSPTPTLSDEDIVKQYFDECYEVTNDPCRIMPFRELSGEYFENWLEESEGAYDTVGSQKDIRRIFRELLQQRNVAIKNHSGRLQCVGVVDLSVVEDAKKMLRREEEGRDMFLSTDDESDSDDEPLATHDASGHELILECGPGGIVRVVGYVNSDGEEVIEASDSETSESLNEPEPLMTTES
jgi:hypothetical protein